MLISKIIRRADDLLMWRCPGCKTAHAIRAKSLTEGEAPGPSWDWDGNCDKPTFFPSVKVSYDGKDAGVDGAPPAVCHSWVRDGQIQFLEDCTHTLAGQTVDIPGWESGR